MTARYDVAAIGNAIVDVISPANDGFLEGQGLAKGAMTLIDDRAASLYDAMSAGIETSGGSAANTAVGVASFGDVVTWDDASCIVLAGSAVVVVMIGDACESVSNDSFAVCLVSMTYHSPQRSWSRCDSGSYPQRKWSPHRRS